MIASFGDKATEQLFEGIFNRAAQRFPQEVRQRALRKLDMLNAAETLRDLTAPPGNRLEKLTGVLRDYYSIRINNQWRLIFKWEAVDAHEVRIIDYH